MLDAANDRPAPDASMSERRSTSPGNAASTQEQAGGVEQSPWPTVIRCWRCTNQACCRETRDPAEAGDRCICEQLIDGVEVECRAPFAPVSLWCAEGMHHVFALARGGDLSACPMCAADAMEPETVRIPVVSMFDLVFAESAGAAGSR